jgi:hypothetical protein
LDQMIEWAQTVEANKLYVSAPSSQWQECRSNLSDLLRSSGRGKEAAQLDATILLVPGR